MRSTPVLALALVSAAMLIAACQQLPGAPSAALPSLSGPAGLSARASLSHTESKVPIPFFIAAIPCVPEDVVVNGAELHVVIHQTVTSSGRVRLFEHFQPIRNWDGIGTVTGDVYQAVGVSRQSVEIDVVDGFPFEQTMVNNFRWIGPGPGNNLQIHTTTHVTIDANGNLTANHVNASVTCS